MNWIQKILVILTVIAVSGCATIPPGPSVMVLPPAGKPFDVFRMEDFTCREWAERQASWDANETANQNIVSGAAIGTLLGAGLGAAIGSASGNAGAGAAIGAVGGIAIGAAGASEPARAAGHEVQRRYDIAYQQCMYSKGNQIPGSVRESRRVRHIPPPPPPDYVPEPPYGYPPPPPY